MSHDQVMTLSKKLRDAELQVGVPWASGLIAAIIKSAGIIALQPSVRLHLTTEAISFLKTKRALTVRDVSLNEVYLYTGGISRIFSDEEVRRVGDLTTNFTIGTN